MSIQFLSNEPFDEHRSIFDFDFSSPDPAAFSSQVKHLTASTKKCIAVNHAQLEEVVCVISHISKCSKFQIDENHCQHAFSINFRCLKMSHAQPRRKLLLRACTLPLAMQRARQFSRFKVAVELPALLQLQVAAPLAAPLLHAALPQLAYVYRFHRKVA